MGEKAGKAGIDKVTPVRSTGDFTIVTLQLETTPQERRATGAKSASRKTKPTKRFEPICLLPGPVALAESVKAAFAEPIVYHRGEEFLPLFQRVRSNLSAIVGGKPSAVLVGSGTLANDAVGATLAAEKDSEGLVLVSGEFGERLLKQARRWNLNLRVLQWDWGQPWNLGEVETALKQMGPNRWVWGVHHETSTGVINDLPRLVTLASSLGHRVCVDCVSSIGTVDVDLSGVYLASGTSGKAIGSYAGLAFIFGQPTEIAQFQAKPVPDYLDVAAALSATGPRFTVPSPLVRSLDVALEPMATSQRRQARFARIAKLGKHLRTCLRNIGCEPLSRDDIANPSIVTFAPPPGRSAAEFVTHCRNLGYLIAGQSGYLAERNLVQIAVMGDVGREHIDGLFTALAGESRP